MRYRISEIRIDPRKVAAEGGGISGAALERELDAKIRRKLSRRGTSIAVSNIEVIRESVDARKKPNVNLVYTVDFECEASLNLPLAETKEYFTPEASVLPQKSRPVIAGFGPCGIFAALILAEAGLRPVVIERGKAIDERVADVEGFWNSEGDASPNPESNVQFGEGGAGTFSDGKLTTGIRDIRIRKVLQSFVDAGADPSILYKHKPHIGTDELRQVVKNLRQKIEEMGGEVRFSTRLEGLEVIDGSLKAVKVRDAAGSIDTIETEKLILAIGHSARDTFRMLYEDGFDMKQKPFSIGVRIEHPQTVINRAQYGDESLAEILGPAEYKMSYRCREDSGNEMAGRGVYTFCMCPGGEVVNASTEAGTSVTNGMSNRARDGEFANSAVLVDVRTSDFGGDSPLAGIAFQQKYEALAWENRTERGMARCTYGEFADSRERGGAVRNSLPAFAREAILEAVPEFGRKLKGFDDGEARLTAVESRSSSPVRILRDENMEITRKGASVKGIIPAGEGPGYAGGITSAAVEGIKAAEKVVANY